MNYLTSQRKVLYETLEQHCDEILSADQIISLIGDRMSRSAVYRNLATLEKYGVIKRTAAPRSKTVMYRYIGSETCKNHLHLKCTECGNIYHLNAPTTTSLVNNVIQAADFKVDSSITVLYGVCKNCRQH